MWHLASFSLGAPVQRIDGARTSSIVRRATFPITRPIRRDRYQDNAYPLRAPYRDNAT